MNNDDETVYSEKEDGSEVEEQDDETNDETNDNNSVHSEVEEQDDESNDNNSIHSEVEEQDDESNNNNSIHSEVEEQDDETSNDGNENESNDETSNDNNSIHSEVEEQDDETSNDNNSIHSEVEEQDDGNDGVNNSVHSEVEEQDDGNDDDNDGETSNDDNENENEETMSIDYFKESIKQYLELDEEIKILDKASKIRKEKKKKLSECILSFIQEKDISHINLQGNYKGKQIQSKDIVKKTSVSFKSITDIIFDFFDDKTKARTLLDTINNKRETSTSSKLQIAKPQKKKNNSHNLNKLITNKNIDNSSLEDQIPDNLKYLYTTTTN